MGHPPHAGHFFLDGGYDYGAAGVIVSRSGSDCARVASAKYARFDWPFLQPQHLAGTLDPQDVAERVSMSDKVIRIPRNAGKFARDRRKQLGLTQRELAQRSGVSERTIYSFELGEKPGIHLGKMLAVYEALGLVLKVEEVNPAEHPGAASRSKEQLIADFLAQVGVSAHGAD